MLYDNVYNQKNIIYNENTENITLEYIIIVYFLYSMLSI